MCIIADYTADRAVVLEEIIFTVHLKKKATNHLLRSDWLEYKILNT